MLFGVQQELDGHVGSQFVEVVGKAYSGFLLDGSCDIGFADKVLFRNGLKGQFAVGEVFLDILEGGGSDIRLVGVLWLQFFQATLLPDAVGVILHGFLDQGAEVSIVNGLQQIGEDPEIQCFLGV